MMIGATLNHLVTQKLHEVTFMLCKHRECGGLYRTILTEGPEQLI